MAFPGTYSKIEEERGSFIGEEEDMDDNASDTTKFSSTAELFDKTHFLPQRENSNPSTSSPAQRRAAKRAKKVNIILTWLRWGVVIGLQTIIILLLSRNRSQDKNSEGNSKDATAAAKTVETGSDINGLYKTRKHSFILERGISRG